MKATGAVLSCAAVLFVLSSGLVARAAAESGQGPSPITTNADPDFQWTRDWVETPQWGGRVGFVDGRGFLRVRVRSRIDSEWVVVAKDVKSFQLFDWRLAVLTNDGRLLQQEGPLNAPLAEIARGVCAYELTLTRTGILGCDHTLSVREMGFPARSVASGVKAFQLESDRAAVLGFDGVLWAQRGGQARGFQKIASNVQSFQMERDWIAYRELLPPTISGKAEATRLMIGTWRLGTDRLPSVVESARDVADFELEAFVEGDDFRTRIRAAVVHTDGSLAVAAGQSLPLSFTTLDRGPFGKVAWGGGRLAVWGASRLRIGSVETDGLVAGFRQIAGEVSAFHLSAEGALAVTHPGGPGFDLYDLASCSAGDSTSADASEGAAIAPGAPSLEMFQAVPVSMSPAETVEVSTALSGVQLSSLRPRHVRRMTEGPPLGLAAVRGEFAAMSVRFTDDPVAPPPASSTVSHEAARPAAVEVAARPLASSTSVPLYQLDWAAGTDHFYTTSASERLAAQNLGYADQGIACWVEPSQVAGTLPFWRFYSGAQTDHFYTTDSTEYATVISQGFVFEGIEGYLYSGQASGTVGLYRLSRWNPVTYDLDHFYTTSSATVDAMKLQGWTYDRIAGYVWPSGPAPAGDDATPVSATVPTAMTAGQSYTGSVTMRNTGGTTWTSAALYRLGSQNPQDNTRWGASRIELPASVPPGATVTFSIPFVAPKAGTYNFQWQMVHDGVAWFGAPTTNIVVTVSSSTNRLPRGYLDAISTTNFSVQGWAYDPDVPAQSIIVHIEIDGTPVADVVTDQYRPDVNSAFGLTGNHGFLWYLTGVYRSGTHTLRAWAVDPATADRVELALSPSTYTIATGAYSISGNTGSVAGVTVTAGSYSATSDASGSFTLSNLPAATYTLIAAKSGCVFYPASQRVTVGPSRSGIFFSSPCRLNYPLRAASFADQYIQAYPYASNTASAIFKFRESYYVPNNVYPCRAKDDGRVTCRPYLPLYKSRQGDGTVCQSLLSQTRTVTHVRPRVTVAGGNSFLPYGTNNYYFCSTCGVFGIDACSPQSICAYEDFKNYIQVSDALGNRGGAIGCASPFQPYHMYWNGIGSANVYEGEITPNGWGIVPASSDLAHWETLIPGSQRLFANDSSLGIATLSGDGYWTSEPIVIGPTPILGGGNHAECLFNAEECLPLTSRSSASRFGDQWYITISGYLTGDTIGQNVLDSGIDLVSLAQISQGGTAISVNSHVDALIAWITLNQAYNVVFLGHSLGAMDALVLYQLGYGSTAVLYALPGVVPDSALLETTSPAVAGTRQIIAYGGRNDSVANAPSPCYGSVNQCRVQLCNSTGRCQFFEIDTGSGFISLDNPHDRCRYEAIVDPSSPICW